MIENMIIIAVLLAIVGGSLGYIIHAKKNGKKCIGCPDSGKCGKSSCGGSVEK